MGNGKISHYYNVRGRIKRENRRVREKPLGWQK
jgi:hypothetical protein